MTFSVTAQTATVNTSGATAITTGSMSPAASSLVVIAVGGSTSVPSSVTDSLSNTYSFILSKTTTVNASIVSLYEFYYASAPGSITFTVNFSSSSRASVQPYFCPGANSSQTGQKSASATGTTVKTVEVASTATAAGSFFIGVATQDDNFTPTITAASGCALDTNSTVNAGLGTISQTFHSTAVTTGTTSVNYGYTFTSSGNETDWAIITTEVLPAPPGNPAGFMPFFM
jgi:hypothetical protein